MSHNAWGKLQTVIPYANKIQNDICPQTVCCTKTKQNVVNLLIGYIPQVIGEIITSYLTTKKQTLMAIKLNDLCSIDERGKLQNLLKLQEQKIFYQRAKDQYVNLYPHIITTNNYVVTFIDKLNGGCPILYNTTTGEKHVSFNNYARSASYISYNDSIFIVGGFLSDDFFGEPKYVNNIVGKVDGYSSKNVYKFKNVTDICNTLFDRSSCKVQDMKFTRIQPSSIVFNDKLYVVGGSCSTLAGFTTEYYNGKDWALCGAELNVQRQGHGTVIYDDKIMVIGGTTYDQTNNIYIPTRTVEIYDHNADKWIMFGQLNFDHAYIRTLTLNGQIICFSCCCLSGDNNNVVAEIFDPITNQFQISKMFSNLISESSIMWTI